MPKNYKVLAAFNDKKSPKSHPDENYTKVFGPFAERKQAESTVVQIAGQQGCQSAEIQEFDSE